MPEQLAKAFLHTPLSDPLRVDGTIDKSRADLLFQFFRTHRLFRWKDANNDCEDRANAICMLLDKWNIPNYKGWVFSGAYLGKSQGNLVNYWNYHVATVLPVMENDGIQYYVIDPATLASLSNIEYWADNVTGSGNCYYVITTGETYIFQQGKIREDGWFRRNSQNFKWTIQGLSGINGVSKSGQAQLFFCRQRILKTAGDFKNLMHSRPDFLNG